MKAFIYARQSSGAEDLSESVEMQIYKCRELAAKEHIEIADVFFDNATSGKTYPTGSEQIAELDIAFKTWYANQAGRKMYREGLGALIARLSEVDCIVCWDVTRLYRPVTGSFLESYMHQLLVSSHIKVFAVSGGLIDFSSFSDSLVLAMQNRINDTQIKIQTAKSKAALKKLKDSGEHTSSIGRMYGYVSAGRKHIEIDEATAPIVKDVYSMYIKGVGLLELTRIVNQRYKQVLNGMLSRMRVKSILTNPAYCGYAYDSNGSLIKLKATAGKELVTFSDWTEASKRVLMKKTNKAREKKKWLPLSGLLKCSVCGRSLILKARTGYDYGYYTCMKFLEDGEKPCGSVIVSSYRGEEGDGVLEAVKPLLLAYAVKRLKTSIDKAKSNTELESLKVKVANLKAKEAKLSKMYAEGTIDDSVFEQTMKAVVQMKTSTLQAISQIEHEMSSDDTAGRWLDLIVRMHLDDTSQHGMQRGELESLTVETIRSISVSKDELVVKTPLGSVALPRRTQGRRNVVCCHWLDIKLDEAIDINAVYYSGVRRDIDDDWRSKSTQIGRLGDLAVWSMA